MGRLRLRRACQSTKYAEELSDSDADDTATATKSKRVTRAVVKKALAKGHESDSNHSEQSSDFDEAPSKPKAKPQQKSGADQPSSLMKWAQPGVVMANFASSNTRKR